MDCDVVLNDSYVSEKHLRVHLAKKGFRFKDNQTENGTWIGDKQVSEGFQPFDDWLRIGKSKIIIRKK